MELFVILDATHYPVAIYHNPDNAYKALAERNKGLTDNLCYLVRSRLLDYPVNLY